MAQGAPQAPPTATVLGIPLALADYESVMDYFDQVLSRGARAYVTAAAVHLIMRAQEEPLTRAAVLGASLVVPDGQPLVWALRALGHRPPRTRVYGPELMARYCARCAAEGTVIYLYGGRSEEALALLRTRLLERFPGLRIGGGHSPPFREATAAEDAQIAQEISASGAQVVWVGIGQPKQEQWMARMRPSLEAPLLVGVGAAFDFHAGLVRQAPAWIGAHGVEWLFRLVHEPQRLWRRYARYNPRFVIAVAREWASQRTRSTRRGR